MAAGPFYTGSGPGDLNIALAAATIREALATSVKNRQVFGHPVIRAMLAQDAGLGQLMGALGMQFGFLDLGQSLLVATAEGTEPAATNITATSTNLSPARYSHVRSASDFGRSVQEALLRGDLAPSAYAMFLYDGVMAWMNTIIDQIGDLASTATYEIGTTGVALTVQAFKDGVYALKGRGCTGPFLCCLTEKGCNDLSDDGLTLGGAVEHNAQLQQLMPSAATGAYIGTYFGNIDIYMLDAARLDTDGGDSLGFCISPGAIATKHQQVPLPTEATRLVDAGLVTLEMRRPGGGVTYFDTVSHFAVGVQEQVRWANVRYVT